MSTRSRSLGRISVVTFLIVNFFVDTPRASDDVDVALVRDVPILHVVWNDAYDLFPPTGFDRMRDEVERIFAENGIAVRVHYAEKGQSRDDFPDPAVNAILLPLEAASWKLRRDAMAAAIGEAGMPSSIFIFHSVVKRALGHDEDRATPRLNAELARGMGRIVAHELVHVLAPKQRHSRTGLMAEKLTRKVLLGDTIVLDTRSRRVVLAAIEALARSKVRAAAGP